MERAIFLQKRKCTVHKETPEKEHFRDSKKEQVIEMKQRRDSFTKKEFKIQGSVPQNFIEFF